MLTAAVIKTRRAELHMTREALAYKLGVTVNTIARWEQGRLQVHALREPSVRAALSLPLEQEEIAGTPEKRGARAARAAAAKKSTKTKKTKKEEADANA